MSSSEVTSSQRQQMIAEAAYFRAERRGFNGGDPVRDWCEAEAEIDARLRERRDGQLVERIEESLQAVATKGKRAGRKVRAQAQKIRDEIVELTQRLESTAQR
jgi:hypothetical protein